MPTVDCTKDWLFFTVWEKFLDQSLTVQREDNLMEITLYSFILKYPTTYLLLIINKIIVCLTMYSCGYLSCISCCWFHLAISLANYASPFVSWMPTMVGGFWSFQFCEEMSPLQSATVPVSWCVFYHQYPHFRNFYSIIVNISRVWSCGY